MTETIRFDARADIEPTADGFAIIQPAEPATTTRAARDAVRVEFSDLLAERFTINVLAGARRGRTGATA